MTISFRPLVLSIQEKQRVVYIGYDVILVFFLGMMGECTFMNIWKIGTLDYTVGYSSSSLVLNSISPPSSSSMLEIDD
jgi:hypothetical protein